LDTMFILPELQDSVTRDTRLYTNTCKNSHCRLRKK
jgi:hypothetical protein